MSIISCVRVLTILVVALARKLPVAALPAAMVSEDWRLVLGDSLVVGIPQIGVQVIHVAFLR
jgi:hypothetical protein